MDGGDRSSTPAGGRVVQWVIALSLAIIAGCLVLKVDESSWLPRVQAQTTRMAPGDIYAFAGQLGPKTYGLFMVDLGAGNLWCYEYSNQKDKLRLVAARSFLYDRCLEEFNVDSPTPREVAQLVQRLRDRQSQADGKKGSTQEK
ncbi:MAG: hypothetical protein JXQ73_15960 [Phycisphaerae bacterium]|nr:hypothetical protein [Phycisphaerae bacterium]